MRRLRAVRATQCIAPSIRRSPVSCALRDRFLQVAHGLKILGSAQAPAPATSTPSPARRHAERGEIGLGETPGDGNKWLRPSTSPDRRGKRRAVHLDQLPSNRVAAGTVICWPRIARTASSKPSQAPGTAAPAAPRRGCQHRIERKMRVDRLGVGAQVEHPPHPRDDGGSAAIWETEDVDPVLSAGATPSLPLPADLNRAAVALSPRPLPRREWRAAAETTASRPSHKAADSETERQRARFPPVAVAGPPQRAGGRPNSS